MLAAERRAGAAGRSGAGGTVLFHAGRTTAPPWLEALRRDWMKARARVLRLGGSGEGWPVSGQVAGLGGPGQRQGSGAEPFRALLFEDVLVVAREAATWSRCSWLSLENGAFDEATYTVRVDEWPGAGSGLLEAGQADRRVRRPPAREPGAAGRGGSGDSGGGGPRAPGGPAGRLAGMWMPGRLLELAEWTRSVRGSSRPFAASGCRALRHAEEGAYLLDWAVAAARTWLGCTRERGRAPRGETRGRARRQPRQVQRPLWMLAGKDGIWFLEALSIEDHATYCFTGGDEIPALVSRLLCAPQFSKEALYSPLGGA